MASPRGYPMTLMTLIFSDLGLFFLNHCGNQRYQRYLRSIPWVFLFLFSLPSTLVVGWASPAYLQLPERSEGSPAYLHHNFEPKTKHVTI